MTRDTALGFVVVTLRVSAGLLIWAAHLAVVYVVTALACARHVADVQVMGVGAVRVAIVVVTGLALTAAAWTLAAALGDLRRKQDDTGAFLSFLTATMAGFALVAVAWSGLPAFLVPVCG